jgi:DNA-binding CsgD family transcriptional regulator
MYKKDHKPYKRNDYHAKKPVGRPALFGSDLKIMCSCLAKGMTVKQTANELCISERGLQFRLQEIKTIFGVKTIAELVYQAVKVGIID